MVDVRSVGSILVATLFAPQNIGHLVMVGARKLGLAHDDLFVAIAIASLGRALRHVDQHVRSCAASQPTDGLLFIRYNQ